MMDSRCCFRCLSVRNGTRVISIINMLVCIILMIRTLFVLNLSPYPYKTTHSYSITFDVTVIISYIIYWYTHHLSQPIENDFITFSQLFVLFLFFYINLNLKKATHLHTTQSINQWLKCYSILCIFFFLFTGFCAVKKSTPIIIPIGILGSMYQIYVVRSYYHDVLKFSATFEGSVITQNTLHSLPFVTINSLPTTMLTPNQFTQVDSHVRQQLHQPIKQVSYSQHRP